MTIQFPSYPASLRTKETNTKLLAQECTALLVEDATIHSREWLTDEDRKVLTSGGILRRRNVLYKHYVHLLEVARQEAFLTGFAEPGILPAATLEALELNPFNRLASAQSRALRDAIGAVKRLDDEDKIHQPNEHTSSGGRSKSKKEKAQADRLLRMQMRGKQGQKPGRGQRAA